MEKQIQQPATYSKPAYLLEKKEDLIAERDYMEANWDESMIDRMMWVCKISAFKFKTPLSNLK